MFPSLWRYHLQGSCSKTILVSAVGNLEEETSSKKGSSQKEQQQQDRRIDIQPAEDEEGMGFLLWDHFNREFCV